MLHAHIINEIIKKIKMKGALSDSRIRDALKEWGDEKVISIFTVDDIMDRAKDIHKKITQSQAFEIIDNLDHDFDANIGINWDVIDTHIEMIEQ